MAEISGPLENEPFTGDLWRTATGRQGIVQDYAGTAYRLTLPPDSDSLLVNPGKSVVAGFAHEVPTGETHALAVPPSTNGPTGRTDVIGVAFDPAFTTTPGPCRLIRIPGTEGSADRPNIDMTPPGVEVMPLWTITRKQGQSLNQAALVDLRRWVGPTAVAAATADPIGSMPVGSHLVRGTELLIRGLNQSGAPQWISSELARLTTMPWAGIADATVATSGFVDPFTSGGWSLTGMNSVAYLRAKQVELHLKLRNNQAGTFAVDGNGVFTGFPRIGDFPDAFRPGRIISADVLYRVAGGDLLPGKAMVDTAGRITLRSGVPNRPLSPVLNEAVLHIDVTYTAPSLGGQ